MGVIKVGISIDPTMTTSGTVRITICLDSFLPHTRLSLVVLVTIDLLREVLDGRTVDDHHADLEAHYEEARVVPEGVHLRFLEVVDPQVAIAVTRYLDDIEETRITLKTYVITLVTILIHIITGVGTIVIKGEDLVLLVVRDLLVVILEEDLLV